MKTIPTLLTVAALVLASSSAQADSPQAITNHDPSCFTVYENITGTVSVGPFLPPGQELIDDVHTAVSGSVFLCAVDVRGRATAAGTLSVRVYANNGDALVPGVLLAGPIDLVFAASSGSTATYHFEFPLVSVGQDLWIGVGWQGASGGWAATPRTTPTIGTSHDTWYYRSGGGDFFDDNGTNQADLHVVVYGTAPVPVDATTWGSIKAVYR